METKSLDQLIEITPGIMSGRPRIAGHRITVSQIAIWHLRQGMSIDEIADDYSLEPVEIYAALAYYFLNQKAIDQSIIDADAFIEEMRQKSPSILEEKLKQMRRA